MGKSTVSILLANKLVREGKKVVLCDLDVECPNDHLLLGVSLGDVGRFVYAQFPKLNRKKCAKCGLCVSKCPSHAVFQPSTARDAGQKKSADYPVFMPELCSSCGLCWHICPQGAIEIEKKKTGEVFFNKLRTPNSKLEAADLWLITGRSVGVLEESGPVVTAAREFAQDFARQKDADYLLMDTAVGMHCGVIRALLDVDYAYVVTEPTPLGAHDLALILRLLKKLGVSARIVLNQSNLGRRDWVDKIARDFGVKIDWEIPFSQDLVEAYSQGRLGRVDLFNNHD